MKLRILDNTIRLRLRKSEVVQFGKEGFLEGHTELAQGCTFVYRLEMSDAVSSITARPLSCGIAVEAPRDLAQAWVGSSEIALSTEGPEGGPDILIEKDFQRTSVRSLLDFDLYPNPRSSGAPRI